MTSFLRTLPPAALICVGWVVWWSAAASRLPAADPSDRVRPAVAIALCRAGAAPHAGTVHGVAVADALDQIAVAGEINIWFDRATDPSTPIDLAPDSGRTVWQTIDAISSAANLVAVPIDNVIVVAAPRRIDALVAAVADTLTRQRSAARDIRWAALTSPAEALQKLGQVAVAVGPDRMRAVTMRSIAPEVVAALIAVPRSEPATPRPNVDLVHPASIAETARGAAATVVRGGGDLVRVQGNWALHRELLRRTVSEFRRPPAAPSHSDDRTFTLRVRAPAVDVLRSLAAAAGRQLRIEPAAAAAVEPVIALEARDETLAALIDRVGDQMGVTVIWQDAAIVIGR